MLTVFCAAGGTKKLGRSICKMPVGRDAPLSLCAKTVREEPETLISSNWGLELRYVFVGLAKTGG